MIAIRNRPERCVDRRHQIVQDHILECAETRLEISPGRTGPDRNRWCSSAGCVAPIHYHDHGLSFPFVYEIVEDEIGIPLFGPARFIFARPMLQDQHRVARLRTCVVTGRSIDQAPPPLSRDLGEVPFLADLTMGNLLHFIEVDTRFRYFDPAGFFAVAEVGLAAGVVDLHTLQHEPIVMKAWDGRWSLHGPDTVVALGHREWTLA